MKKIVLLITLSVWICSGCAMTMDRVNINYAAPPPQSGNSTLKAQLSIGEIQDKRRLEDSSIIFHKTNLNGQTTVGAYIAGEPLPNIVKRAIQDYFAQYEIDNVNNNKFELYGNIVDFKYRSFRGYFSLTLRSELIMKFFLKDVSSNKIVWHETFFGIDTVKDFSDFEDAINQMLQASLNDLLKQLSNSKTLSNYL